DDVVLRGVVVALVHTDDEGRVLVLRRSGDDDLLGAGLAVGLGLLGVGEDAGGLDDDVGADLAPREVVRIALGVRLEGVVVDGDGVRVVRAVVGKPPADRVVLDEVRERRVVGEVVHTDDLDVRLLLESGAQEVSADAAESVDSNLDGQGFLLDPQRELRNSSTDMARTPSYARTPPDTPADRLSSYH